MSLYHIVKNIQNILIAGFVIYNMLAPHTTKAFVLIPLNFGMMYSTKCGGIKISTKS
jgi:hypothetical protein